MLYLDDFIVIQKSRFSAAFLFRRKRMKTKKVLKKVCFYYDILIKYIQVFIRKICMKSQANGCGTSPADEDSCSCQTLLRFSNEFRDQIPDNFFVEWT